MTLSVINDLLSNRTLGGKRTTRVRGGDAQRQVIECQHPAKGLAQGPLGALRAGAIGSRPGRLRGGGTTNRIRRAGQDELVEIGSDAELEAVDRFLHEHAATRLAMRWIESGLDVAFDSESRVEYAAASSEDLEAFEEFIQYSAHMADQHDNMDW